MVGVLKRESLSKVDLTNQMCFFSWVFDEGRNLLEIVCLSSWRIFWRWLSLGWPARWACLWWPWGWRQELGLSQRGRKGWAKGCPAGLQPIQFIQGRIIFIMIFLGVANMLSMSVLVRGWRQKLGLSQRGRKRMSQRLPSRTSTHSIHPRPDNFDNSNMLNWSTNYKNPIFQAERRLIFLTFISW